MGTSNVPKTFGTPCIIHTSSLIRQTVDAQNATFSENQKIVSSLDFFYTAHVSVNIFERYSNANLKMSLQKH